jgi:hypothetical protein
MMLNSAQIQVRLHEINPRVLGAGQLEVARELSTHLEDSVLFESWYLVVIYVACALEMGSSVWPASRTAFLASREDCIEGLYDKINNPLHMSLKRLITFTTTRAFHLEL